MTETTLFLGLRSGNGGSAAVVLGPGPTVVARHKVVMSDGSADGQAYHAAHADPANAERIVRATTKMAQRLAKKAVAAVLADVRDRGTVGAVGMALGSGFQPTVAQALKSHPAMHAAEGELYREALMHAAEGLGLPIHAVREKDLAHEAPAALGCSAEDLDARLVQLGKAVGPPWRQPEKAACLVAWMAMLARS